MAYRELELTLLSAQDLKNVNLLTRMDVYAVATISGNPLTRQCTAPDPSGGRNPCWNTTLRFAVPPTAEAAAAAAGASLHVLLRAERVLGDRDVGEVVVPLADLLAAAPATTGPKQMASYQVRKVHRWEPRGVLNLSYRLGPVVAPVAEATEKKPPPPPPIVMAYPVGVPASQPPFRPQVEAYSPPPRRSGEYEEKAMAPAPALAPRNGKDRDGPTQVCVGPHTQIILGGPTGSNASSPRWKADGARPRQDFQHQQHDDRSRPKVFSQHETQVSTFQETEATNHHQQQRAVVPSPSREPARLSSRSSSSSSASPYSAYLSTPSPRSSPHSYAPSPYSAPHLSTPSPRKPAVGDAFGANKTTIDHTNSPRSVSTHRAAASSPLSSSPLVANHSGMMPSQ